VPSPQDVEQADQVVQGPQVAHPPSTGHSPGLQDPVSVSVAIPVQSSPPLLCGGESQVLVLVLVLVPPPQDTEQEDQVVHEAHLDHSPSTGQSPGLQYPD